MLKVERLTKTYNAAGGPLTVLRDVTFELPAGASIAVVGPSGSGKTTLLGLCAGLDRPSDGEVILAGEPIGALSEDARALVRNRHVGFMFQNFQLVPTLTALENVTVPIELRGEGGREVMEAGRELLGRVGLAERLPMFRTPLRDLFQLSQASVPPSTILGRALQAAVYGRTPPQALRVPGADATRGVFWRPEVNEFIRGTIQRMHSFNYLEPGHEVSGAAFHSPFLDPDMIAASMQPLFDDASRAAESESRASIRTVAA